MSAEKMILQLRLRVYCGKEAALGPGRAELLARVSHTASIAQAARDMGMSYMKAWKLVQSMNGCFREPLIEVRRGGKSGGEAKLTPSGVRRWSFTNAWKPPASRPPGRTRTRWHGCSVRSRRRDMVSFFRRWGLLAGALLLTLAADCSNWRQVFDGAGGIDFVDADCYSRMTRVREVCAHPGEVIRRHGFENYPFGTRPHTTIPFDYAVYALRTVLWPFYGGERALDLAGAWVSPLLGLLTVFVIWLWLESERFAGPGVRAAGAVGEPDFGAWVCVGAAGSSIAHPSVHGGSARGGMDAVAATLARVGLCERRGVGGGFVDLAL